MKRFLARSLALMVVGTSCFSFGCAVATDLVNPSLFAAIGIDQNTVIPSQGTIIVAYENTTDQVVIFQSFFAKDSTDFTTGTRFSNTIVKPGETVNEVADCPVGFFTPGSLGNNGLEAVGATVVGGNSTTDVNYENAPLFSGRDYGCGDVIVVTVAGDGTTFAIQIRVIPGR